MLPAQPLDEQLRRRNQELGGEGVFWAPMMCAKRTYLFASRQPRSWQESVATVPMRPEAEAEGERRPHDAEASTATGDVPGQPSGWKGFILVGWGWVVEATPTTIPCEQRQCAIEVLVRDMNGGWCGQEIITESSSRYKCQLQLSTGCLIERVNGECEPVWRGHN